MDNLFMMFPDVNNKYV